MLRAAYGFAVRRFFFLGPTGLRLELAPGVVYEAGVRYRGVDVGAMLDDWLATGTLPRNVSIRAR